MNSKQSATRKSERAVESCPHRREWEQSVQPSIAVVEAVATATGRDPTALPPLHATVETDSLDTLVTGARASDETIRLTFDYAGTTVVVDTGDGVCVWPDRRADTDPRNV
jgi:hypothetical protein